MIKQYVVVEQDDDRRVIAVWGPFPDEEAASTWEGIPSSEHEHDLVVRTLFEPPVWEELPAKTEQTSATPDPAEHIGPDIDR